MRQAMAEAHRLMGPDALILDHRKIEDGIELTVAIDPDEMPHPNDAWRKALAFHRVPRRLAAAWADQSPDTALAASFRFGSIDFDRPLLLAGPPGAGKTLTTVKLAARLVRAGLQPTLINADQNRAGASAQLAALSRVLRAEFIDAAAGGQPTTRKSAGASPSPVLIDLPGMDAFDNEDMALLRHMIDAVSGSAVLVLPAGLDSSESAEIAERFHGAGATTLIPSRLDLSRRLGGMAAAAAAAPFILAEAGISGRVVNGLEPLTPGFLAARLLGQHRKDNSAHAA